MLRPAHTLVVVLVLAIPLLSCGGAPPPPTRTPPSGPASYFLSIQHEDEMGQAFDLVRLRITLGGEQVYVAEVPDPEAEDMEPLAAPICALRRLVQAGTHEVGVEITYRGRGHGVFSYLRGYSFDVESTHEVTVPANAFGVLVTSAGYEGGGATTPLEERPQVRWTEHVERDDPNGGCRP